MVPRVRAGSRGTPQAKASTYNHDDNLTTHRNWIRSRPSRWMWWNRSSSPLPNPAQCLGGAEEIARFDNYASLSSTYTSCWQP